MFAQQFHCLHGQAKFRCEACCICFKLRKNFMSHVQMVHGVDIPEEVLARMRPRSEIHALANEHSSVEQAKEEESKEERFKSKDKKSDEPEIICISDDSPVKKSKVLQSKAVTDVKQTESGGNSSADESEKKDEGRVYLTTVRMGNTYVTLPSGEKWMIECLRCHQAFFKMEDASVHMKQRPGSHFSCPHCHYSSTLFSQCDYEIHRLRTHSFPCAQCRQSFILECQRDMHEQKIHNYFRQLMRKKTPVGASGKTTLPGAQVKSAAGTQTAIALLLSRTKAVLLQVKL
ncbi:zinc finger protein 260-like [Strongylocentrotus purpuratus]|uniref:C2H2-type domain-containing protein n=1 Tax=Strongylocentrotus purpuratus TaxID=7668 RepID=A0A7M7NB28_STRPU|nr:zinc finger protein 260-like [Strongylocentrotus purpuratus]